MRRLLAALLAAYALHFAWEMAHSPLFATMRELPFWTATAWCARAAGWDVLINAIAYAAAALTTRSVRWAQHLRALPLAVYLGVGLGITVAMERWAVAAGRWQYAEAMPTLFGVGLSPLLQWVVVPGVLVIIIRRVMPVAR